MFGNSRLAAWLKSVSRVSSATLILEDTEGQALIVKANYKRYWTFPGGVIDIGETPLQGAIRETYEEVGIEVDPATVTFAWVANRSSKLAETYQFVFRAPLPAGVKDQIRLQASEIDAYAFVTKDDILHADRTYGKVLQHWAAGASGYIEQTFTIK